MCSFLVIVVTLDSAAEEINISFTSASIEPSNLYFKQSPFINWGFQGCMSFVGKKNPSIFVCFIWTYVSGLNILCDYHKNLNLPYLSVLDTFQKLLTVKRTVASHHHFSEINLLFINNWRYFLKVSFKFRNWCELYCI